MYMPWMNTTVLLGAARGVAAVRGEAISSGAAQPAASSTSAASDRGSAMGGDDIGVEWPVKSPEDAMTPRNRLLLGALLITGCSSSGGSNKCAGVSCPMGEVCQPS